MVEMADAEVLLNGYFGKNNREFLSRNKIEDGTTRKASQGTELTYFEKPGTRLSPKSGTIAFVGKDLLNGVLCMATAGDTEREIGTDCRERKPG